VPSIKVINLFLRIIRAVHTQRPQSEGYPVRIFCKQGGVLQKRTSELFSEKRRSFRNLWCIRTNKGIEPVRTLCGQGGRPGGEGGRINLSRFCADVCLLWTAPNFVARYVGLRRPHSLYEESRNKINLTLS